MLKMFSCFGAAPSPREQGSPARPTVQGPVLWFDDASLSFHPFQLRGGNDATYVPDCIINISTAVCACSEAVNHQHQDMTCEEELTDASGACSVLYSQQLQARKQSNRNLPSQQQREPSQTCRQVHAEGVTRTSLCSEWADWCDEVDEAWQPEDVQATSQFSFGSRNSLSHSELMM